MNDQQPSSVPALVQPAQTREVARTDTDSWTNIFGNVVELARGIAETEFVPRGLRGSIPATTAAILYGREVGLPPMTALNQTHVIEGKPSMAAEAMRAMVLAAGHEIEVLESTGAVCRMRARRRGSERWTPEVVWSIDMARAANLTNKPNWKNHPRRMLQARASSELCELHFPDVVLGFKSIEEMEDSADADGAAETPSAGTRVSRKRAPRKTAAATPPPAAAPPVAGEVDGPPLPGEPGFDDPVPQAPAPVGESAGGEDGGEAAEPPADDHLHSFLGDGVNPGRCRCGAIEESTEHPESADMVDAEFVEDPPPPDPEPAAEVDDQPNPRPSSRGQHRLIFARFTELEVADENRHHVVSTLIGRPVESFNAMTQDEAKQLIETLGFVESPEALAALVRGVEERTAGDGS